MTKYLMILFTMVALAFGGCGYKAPPYYEKSPTEAKNVAL